MATAQRARHVHDDPDCLVSVRFGDGFGDSVSHTVPFYRGYAPPHAVLCLDLAGLDLTENLMQFATEHECPFAATAERESVREVKEKQCHSSLDHDTELKSTAEIDLEKTSSPSRRTFPFRGNVVRRTQSPSKVTLCITPSFVGLAVVSQSIS